MGKKRKGANLICKGCENTFYVPEYRKETAKFCSIICQNKTQYEKFKFICMQCGKQSSDSPSRKGKRKFCCIECYNIFQTDYKNDQKEKRRLGISAAREKGYGGNSSASIRKFAFSKKEEKCQECGYKEYKCCLDIHHIDENPNNNTIENLAILCVICHRKVHRNIICIGGNVLKTVRRRFPKKNEKLNEKQVKEIKNLLKQKNKTHEEISTMYGVKRECISKINQGKRWK